MTNNKDVNNNGTNNVDDSGNATSGINASSAKNVDGGKAAASDVNAPKSGLVSEISGGKQSVDDSATRRRATKLRRVLNARRGVKGSDSKMVTSLTAMDFDDANIVEGTKKYIFNATGNIMIATTEDDSSNIDDSSRDVFNEVSVFFAAMSKAITTTKRPGTDEYYSLYNYDALRRVIAGSGCFILNTQEDVHYTTQSVGADFSKDLITALLGLPTGGGALSFAQGMIASMSDEGVKLSEEHTSQDSKVGNIVFVCEYLFGMPVVTAMVIYIDSNAVSTTVEAGPCVKVTSTKTELQMHKDVYMFVTPNFIKQYASDLDSIVSSLDYSKFISYLRSLLTGDFLVDSIKDDSGTEVTGSELTAGITYHIYGENFGSTQGTMLFGDKELSCEWTDNLITFTAPSEATGEQALVVKTADGTSHDVGTFTVKSAS